MKWADRVGSAHSRGYGAPWRRIREKALERDGRICVPCKKRRPGFPSPATSVDHIIPKAAGGTDNLENLQSLCNACRREKDRNDAVRGSGGKVRPRIGPDGWPEEPL